jgi:histidinol dehydrogenase
MLGIPAGIAGAREIVLTTPPGPSGIIHPAILYSASLLGIERVYRCGGAQAIGAMAYGTESIPAVDKIFGPGNRYVTAAKVLVSQEGTAIDMAAGPSELAVVADDSTRPDFAAADLLSQMEHGPDSQAVLFTTVKTVAEKVIAAMAEQKKTLPRLRLINASEDSSAAVLFRTEEELIDAVNNYAPEHLILQVSNPGTMAGKIRNAGSVFLGQYSPEAAGDYASGDTYQGHRAIRIRWGN